VAVFALANVLTWLAFFHFTHRNLKLVHVVHFEPGHEAITDRRPTLQWEFNLNLQHDPANDRPAGRITPAVSGKWLWKNDRLLTFTPDADLPPATKFVVALNNDRIRTVDGIGLDHDFVESFSTPHLQLESVRQIGWTQEDQLILEMQFNDGVSPVLCLQHVKVTDPTGREITCALQGEAAGKTVRIQTERMPQLKSDREHQFVNVELSSGLAGASGPLAMTQMVSQRVDVAVDLMAKNSSGYSNPRGEGTISVRFNNDVDQESIRQILSVEPITPFEMSANGQQVELNGAFAPGTRYAVKLAAPPAGADRKKFPRPGILSVFMPDRPARVWFDHPEGYLGTNGNRAVLLHAVNVPEARLSVTRMYDNNLVSWRTGGGSGDQLSGPVVTRVLKTEAIHNQVRDIPISLDNLLPASATRDGVYQLSVTAENPKQHSEDDEDSQFMDFRSGISGETVVTFSDIGLTARQSTDAVDVWAVSLHTAKPLAGVSVRIFSNKNQLLGQGRSDSNGLVHVGPIHPVDGEHPTVILAEMSDVPDRLAGEAMPAAVTETPARGLTWLDLDKASLNFAKSDVGGKTYLRKGFEAFVYTERGVYRPGETLHVRAVVRGPNVSTPGAFPVCWQLRRPDLRDWQSQIVKLDSDGNAALDMPLPSDMPTGRWTADLEMPAAHGEKPTVFGSVAFDVREFMPNRMKIAMEVGPRTPVKNGRLSLSNGPVHCDVQADYLFGQPAADRPVTLTTRVDAATFSLPQWKNWVFGDTADTVSVLHDKEAIGGRVELPEKTLDAKGHATWKLGDQDLPLSKSKNFHGPWRVSFFAAVIDAGGRAVNTTQTVDLDQVPHYLAMSSTPESISPDKPISIDLAAVKPDGSTANSDAKVKVQLYRELWNSSLVLEHRVYTYISRRKLEPVGSAQSIKLSAGRGTVQITAPSAGQFVILAQDTQTGFSTSTSISAYSESWDDNIDRDDPESLQISLVPAAQSPWQIAETNLLHPTGRTFQSLWHHGRFPSPLTPKNWKAGEAAQVIVRSPFAGSLLLSMETDSVVSTQVIAMPHSQLAVPITIPADCRPNGYVTATVIRAIDPNAKWQIHRAFGIARLVLDQTDQKLNVQFQAPPQVQPDNTLSIRVRLTDSNGRPASGAAVTVAAVDEGILGLTEFRTPDPLKYFSALCAHGVEWSDLYNQLMPEVPRPQGSSPVGGDGEVASATVSSRHQTPVSAKRVRPVALISELLHSDGNGWVQTDFSVPEFSGQLRVMAVADHGASLGSGQTEVSVRGPLLVQSNWPRFAAPNDRFTVPLSIFNFTGKPGKAQIAVDLTDDSPPLQLGDSPQHHLVLESAEIPAAGCGEVSLPIVVLPMAKVAHVHLSASLNHEAWQESMELPIRPASPEISVGGYAMASPAKPATMPIAAGQMLAGTQKLQINVAPLPTLQLPEGLQYLDQYPYGCAEQTVSGCFPLVALGDLGEHMAPGIFAPQRIDEKLQSGIIHLIGMQTADGGISMWQGFHQQSWPWASVYAAHFIVEAEHAGHKVPDDFRASLLGYVRSLLDHATDDAEMVEAQCYGCYVLALAGDPPRNVMSRLTELVNGPWSTEADHPAPALDARFHLAAAWLAAGRRDLAEAMIPAKLPSPEPKRQLSGNLASPIKDRSILLSTLLDVQPNNPAIPAIAQELAEGGLSHHWQSTQDIALAVMALGKYLRATKTPPPYQLAEVLLDGQRIGSSTQDQPLVIVRPSSDAKGNLTVRVNGPEESVAHVSWLLSGVPMLSPANEDAGLSVRRRYLNTAGQPITGNHLRGGDLIQIELTVSAPTPLHNVVIDDLLPAGLEIENSKFETTAKADQVDSSKSGNVPNFGASHVDVRDDRLILVGDFAGGQPARFVYLARALTPGVFTVPPVRAECMYDIGTHSVFGGGNTLTIESLNHSAVAYQGANP
jgi:hypothetical protein